MVHGDRGDDREDFGLGLEERRFLGSGGNRQPTRAVSHSWHSAMRLAYEHEDFWREQEDEQVRRGGSGGLNLDGSWEEIQRFSLLLAAMYEVRSEVVEVIEAG